MKAEQISFAAGEISPVLHARTDLTRYRIALAELVNMIVLPQGGVTRRAGINTFGTTLGMNTVKLIPFEYSTTDSVILEFGDRTIRVWQKASTGVNAIAAINGSPYTASEVKDLRYVQSGNVMFLTHKNHKPMMLRRNSLTSWTLKELPFRGGPWISGEEWASGSTLQMSGRSKIRVLYSSTDGVFGAGVEGTLLKIEYAVKAKTIELTSKASPNAAVSEAFVVKGTMNITTAGEWTGLIKVDRSADGGSTWVTVRQYRRTNIDTQGQWDFTISETEDNVLYRVTAQHGAVTSSSTPAPEDNGSSGGSGNSGEYIPTEYPEHPDIEGGENYINRDYWNTLNPMVRVELSDGRTCYYCYALKQTFYVVGHTGIGQYDGIYGYVVDGYPEGYDENGHKIEE